MENFASVLAISAIGGFVGACVVLLASLIKYKLCKRKSICQGATSPSEANPEDAQNTAQDNATEPKEDKSQDEAKTDAPTDVSGT